VTIKNFLNVGNAVCWWRQKFKCVLVKLFLNYHSISYIPVVFTKILFHQYHGAPEGAFWWKFFINMQVFANIHFLPTLEQPTKLPGNSPDENGVMRETPESHWYNQYPIIIPKYPIIKNHLAVKIKPTMFHDNIETDVITMAVQAGNHSCFHAWCENGDGNMLISNILLPLKSARRYCQGRIRISCRNFLRK